MIDNDNFIMNRDETYALKRLLFSTWIDREEYDDIRERLAPAREIFYLNRFEAARFFADFQLEGLEFQMRDDNLWKFYVNCYYYFYPEGVQ